MRPPTSSPFAFLRAEIELWPQSMLTPAEPHAMAAAGVVEPAEMPITIALHGGAATAVLAMSALEVRTPSAPIGRPFG